MTVRLNNQVAGMNLEFDTPIGFVTSIPYMGDLYTDPSGSVWMCFSGTSPFAYDPSYAYLPDSLKSPHPLMAGPDTGGLWTPVLTNAAPAYDPISGKYCTSAWDGDATNGYTYYTSNNGIAWTKRTFPNSPIKYSHVVCFNGRFFGFAVGIVNCVIYSDDGGVTWTSKAAGTAGLGDVNDIAWDGANGLCAIGSAVGNTNCIYSADFGVTWTNTAAGNASATAGTNFPRAGQFTYNAGAGLYLANANGAGKYTTSPTGQVWTDHLTQDTFFNYAGRLGSPTKFASNATTTVAFGVSGFFCTTTDGLTWANHGYISNTLVHNTVPQNVWYDGTRFCVRYAQRVFYSVAGLVWTEGKYIGGAFASPTPCSNGVLFVGSLYGTAPSKLLRVADVTLATPQTVIPAFTLTGIGAQGGIQYVRIR